MRVLLVNKFHYLKGGSETYTFALADLLRGMGHEVIFFSMEDERNLPCEQSPYFAPNRDYNAATGILAKARAAASLIYSAENRRRMEALIARYHPDIAHLNLIHRQLTFSVVEALAAHGIPMVFSAHDLTCVCPANTMLSPFGLCEKCLSGRFSACVRQKCVKNSRLKSLLAAGEARYLRARKLYDLIDLYLTPSEFLRTKLQAGRFTKSRIITLPHFLPQPPARVVDTHREGKLLFVGRLVREKGVATLLQALAQIPSERLDIVGDGPEREALEMLARTLQITERVRFHGYLEHDAVREMLRGCKALAAPSNCYENSPYAVMEALAEGKPILGSRIGGITELVTEGETGFLSEAGNPDSLSGTIRTLNALTEANYRQLCENALAFACDRFSPERYGERLISLYESLLAQPRKRR
jgi:glycosyltransferase involved in cell wall biosynthesis